MSEGKEKDVQDQKQAEELAPEDLEKTVGGAFDTYLNLGGASTGSGGGKIIP